jgi:hypothetical protein
MSETPGRYTRNDGSPFNKQKSSAEVTAQSFVEGIQTFHWKADYVTFCQVLGLDADNYADQKYQAFQELIERLNEFDTEAIAKMIEWGNPKK